MAITTAPSVVLEPALQEFVEATSTPAFLYELTPAEARKVLDDVQAAPIDKLRVDERWITVPADVGEVHLVARRLRARPRGGRKRLEMVPLEPGFAPFLAVSTRHRP